MKTLAAIVISAFIAALLVFSPHDIFPSVNPIIIHDDPGGMVMQEIRWIDRLQISKTPVQIDGQCVSACTLILKLGDQVCITDNASLGFHAAFDLKTGNILKEDSIEVAQAFYPKKIQDWYMQNIIAADDTEAKANDGHVANKPIFLNSKQLVSLGVKHC